MAAVRGVVTMNPPRLTPIRTDHAPQPAGHYAQGIRAGDMLFISGQLPIAADRSALPNLDFETQAEQAIANMLAVLDAAGGTPGDLARVTAYVVGVEHWPAFNGVYARLLGDARPARTVVPVPELHHGYLVEVDGIALLPQSSESADGQS